MAEHSTIEWTDATWNPVTGCAVVSPGCTNCYAMKLAGTRLQHHPSRAGLTVDSKGGPVWNGEVRLNEEWLTQPLQWKRPRRIFVCAHGDLFAESVPDAWIDRVFAVMALCPQHTFQVLTKRAARMRGYCSRADERGRHPCMTQAALMAATGQWNTPSLDLRSWPLPNVWLGVSAEDQARADERVPDLLMTPAAVRFVSAEPLLGLVDFLTIKRPSPLGSMSALRTGEDEWDRPTLDWIIVGGESGPKARPMHPAWARSIRDQCAAAGVPFFFKQWGEWAPGECATGPATRTERTASLFEGGWQFDSLTPRQSEETHTDDEPDLFRLGKAAAGRLLDGVKHNGMPEARHGL